MDLDEWEFIPDEGFLEIHDDGGKKIFSRKYGKDPNSVFKMNYFICPSPQKESRLPKPKQLVPVPIQVHPTVRNPTDHEVVRETTKIPDEISIKDPNTGALEADQETISQVFFKKTVKNEFVDMKLDSPKSGSRGIMPQIDSGNFQFEEKVEAMEIKNCPSKMVVENSSMDSDDVKGKEVTWGESNGGLNIWKWSLGGIGAICSFGVAAATLCIIILGTGQRNREQKQNNQKLQFQIYADDKRMNQAVQHATSLNEAISAARGVPFTRAHITYGGYYNGF